MALVVGAAQPAGARDHVRGGRLGVGRRVAPHAVARSVRAASRGGGPTSRPRGGGRAPGPQRARALAVPAREHGHASREHATSERSGRSVHGRPPACLSPPFACGALGAAPFSVGSTVTMHEHVLRRQRWGRWPCASAPHGVTRRDRVAVRSGGRRGELARWSTTSGNLRAAPRFTEVRAAGLAPVGVRALDVFRPG